MSTVKQNVSIDEEPADLPEPLPEPGIADMRLETVLSALADPLRLTIARKLLLEMPAYDHPCGWVGFGPPKSTPTHPLQAMREAGIIRQRQ